MDLKTHYKNLYDTSIAKISRGEYVIDNLIDSDQDQRFGITLLLRPSEEIKNNIQRFLSQLKHIEPEQYYYDNSDIHITVLSIISCYNGFQINDINSNDYIKIIEQSLVKTPNLEITFQGLTASPSCIMLQGFTNNDTLNTVRDNLRKNFKNTTLQQSIDQRYAIQTAHSTVVRFRKKLNNKTGFIKFIETHKNDFFGSFKPKTLELVHNDWYQRKQYVKKLATFNL
ncbi:MAG: mutarotase [Flavobacteriaceae bacterium]